MLIINVTFIIHSDNSRGMTDGNKANGSGAQGADNEQIRQKTQTALETKAELQRTDGTSGAREMVEPEGAEGVKGRSVAEGP